MPIRAIATHAVDGQSVTVIHVDADARPDVRDLWRTVGTDRGYAHRVGWGLGPRDGRARFTLVVRVESPVRCEFSIALDYADPDHRALLEGVTHLGGVWITLDLFEPGQPSHLLQFDGGQQQLRDRLARAKEATRADG